MTSEMPHSERGYASRADGRRGFQAPTLNLWGISLAIVAGDFLHQFNDPVAH